MANVSSGLRAYPATFLLGLINLSKNIIILQPLEMNAPGMPTCVVPVKTSGKRMSVRVWGDTCQGYDQGDDIAGWLTKFLEEVRETMCKFRSVLSFLRPRSTLPALSIL